MRALVGSTFTRWSKLLLHIGPRPFDPPAQLQRQIVSYYLSHNTSLEQETWLVLVIMDSFSFVTSGALEMPVNVKMSVSLISCSLTR